MAVTYAELTTQILEYTEVSTAVLSSTITNDFIEHVENRIFRDVDLDVFKSHQTANLIADNAFLSLPGGTTPEPTSLGTVRTMQIYSPSSTTRDFLEQRDISFMNEYWPDRTSTGTPRYWAWWDHNTIYVAPTPESLGTIRTMQIYSPSSTTRDFLEQRDISFMNEYWPDRTSTSTPRYWAWWDHNTIYVAPTPDLAYNVELGITRLPTRLSSSNTTSWLGNNAPSLLLYGCLAEAFKFLKGPAEMLQLYEQSYQRALQALVIEQQGRHRRDEYMHGALRTPLQSQNP